jgi:AAA15 family ATPase/GTPase
MFLQRFRVQNYMIHRDLELGLQPITVLVGPNNGGKSGFFDAMSNFSMVSRGRVQHAYGPGPYSY